MGGLNHQGSFRHRPTRCLSQTLFALSRTEKVKLLHTCGTFWAGNGKRQVCSHRPQQFGPLWGLEQQTPVGRQCSSYTLLGSNATFADARCHSMGTQAFQGTNGLPAAHTCGSPLPWLLHLLQKTSQHLKATVKDPITKRMPQPLLRSPASFVWLKCLEILAGTVVSLWLALW